MLRDNVAREVEKCIWIFSEQQGCKVAELNVHADHVHLLVLVSPKVSISGHVWAVKGRTAIRTLNKFHNLKEKPYWGNHFWARRYCVDTVGLDAEMIRKYINARDKEFLSPPIMKMTTEYVIYFFSCILVFSHLSAIILQFSESIFMVKYQEAKERNSGIPKY